MQKWEYLTVNLKELINEAFKNEENKSNSVFPFEVPLSVKRRIFKEYDQNTYFNKLGQEGWELVSMSGNNEAVFKRPQAPSE